MKKVILATFAEDALSYEAFSKINNMEPNNNLKINQVAIVKKTANSYIVKDYLDNQTESRMFKGSIIGAVIGILGGPLGVVCGWLVGDIAGAGTSYAKNKKTKTVFDLISDALTENETALLMYVDEEDEEVLNIALCDDLNADLVRFDYDEVENDIKEANKHI